MRAYRWRECVARLINRYRARVINRAVSVSGRAVCANVRRVRAVSCVLARRARAGRRMDLLQGPHRRERIESVCVCVCVRGTESGREGGKE